jgi:hypothetical protein
MMIQNTGFMSIVKGFSEKDNKNYVFIRLKHSNVEFLKAEFHLFCTTNTARTKPTYGYAMHLIKALCSGFLRCVDKCSEV